MGQHILLVEIPGQLFHIGIAVPLLQLLHCPQTLFFEGRQILPELHGGTLPHFLKNLVHRLFFKAPLISAPADLLEVTL